MSHGIQAVGGSGIDFDKDGIETILLYVQAMRYENMENLLRLAMKDVQVNNERMSNLNKVRSAINTVIDAYAHDAKSTDKVGDQKDSKKLCADMRNVAEEAGFKELFSGLKPYEKGFGGSLTLGQLRSKQEELRGELEKVSNSQTLMFTKVQGYQNKTLEAAEWTSKTTLVFFNLNTKIIRDMGG